MSRSLASRDDLVANQLLETGAEIIKSGFENDDTALPALLGSLGVRAVIKHANKSTGTFYKRWNSLEEYIGDLTTKLLTESLSSTKRDEILYKNLMHWPQRPDIDTESTNALLDRYVTNCAAKINTDDPHLSVRWHTRPYIATEQISQTHAFQISQSALGFIDGWGIGKPSDRGTLPINPVELLDMIDYRAFIEPVSSQ